MMKWLASTIPEIAEAEPDIDWVERQLRVEMPASLVELCIDYHGGRPAVSNVVIDSQLGTLTPEFRYLYAWLEDAPTNVVSTYRQLRAQPREDWPFMLVPFAGDAAGNEFCLDFGEDRDCPSVAFFDHEGALGRCYFRLSDDFDAFLEEFERDSISAKPSLGPLDSAVGRDPRSLD
jgi:hypothetical protein